VESAGNGWAVNRTDPSGLYAVRVDPAAAPSADTWTRMTAFSGRRGGAGGGGLTGGGGAATVCVIDWSLPP
jgi:hypothetical protein